MIVAAFQNPVSSTFASSLRKLLYHPPDFLVVFCCEGAAPVFHMPIKPSRNCNHVIAFIAVKIFVVALLSGYSPTLLALLLTGLRDFIKLALNIFIFAIIIQAILSWINPDPYNPVSGVLFSITRPVLQPVRRLASERLHRGDAEVGHRIQRRDGRR